MSYISSCARKEALELLPVQSTEHTYSDMYLNLITKFTANAMDTKTHYVAFLCIIIYVHVKIANLGLRSTLNLIPLNVVVLQTGSIYPMSLCTSKCARSSLKLKLETLRQF